MSLAAGRAAVRCARSARVFFSTAPGPAFSLEVLEVEFLWPRWVARSGVTRSTQAWFLTADRQCTELPLLRLPRLDASSRVSRE